LLQICHEKDFQNQLIFGEVMDKSLVSFFDSPCNSCYNSTSPCIHSLFEMENNYSLLLSLLHRPTLRTDDCMCVFQSTST